MEMTGGQGGGLREFKTKEFGRFARHEDIEDRRLCEAANRACRGLIDADLEGSSSSAWHGQAKDGAAAIAP